MIENGIYLVTYHWFNFENVLCFLLGLHPDFKKFKGLCDWEFVYCVCCAHVWVWIPINGFYYIQLKWITTRNDGNYLYSIEKCAIIWYSMFISLFSIKIILVSILFFKEWRNANKTVWKRRKFSTCIISQRVHLNAVSVILFSRL